MSLLLPYHDVLTSCGHCGESCLVRVFNGMKAFEFKPDVTVFHVDWVVMLIRAQYDGAQDAVSYAMEDAPHTTNVCILWTEDERTFELVCKLANNFHNLMEEHDGCTETRKH